MKSSLQKFYIKISRFKGDAASIIGLRLSFVLTFFVSLLVLTILYFTFAYEREQIIPVTADISNAAVVSGLNEFNNVVHSGNYDNLLQKINAQFNYDVVKYVFVTDKNDNVIFSEIPQGYVIDYSRKGLILKPTDANSAAPVMHPVSILKGKSVIYMGFNSDPESSFKLGKLLQQVSFIFIIFSLALTIAITYFVSILILSPLERLRNVASKFSEGDLNDRVNSTYFTEINDLITSYNTMADVLQKLYSTLEAEVSARTKELKVAYSELQSTQAMMVHSEKMKSLGELVAGIMHEINNPINFIYGNMTHLDNYSKDLVRIVEEYSDLDKDLSEELRNKYKSLKEELDYDFIKTDIPDLIKSCKEGAERAKNIIQDLKSFSRFEESAIASVNIEKEIDTCLTILYNKYKNRITIHKEFPENMQTIEAYGGQLNQVFMNILDNAIGAIEGQGDIWVRASFTNNNVRVEIEDNGSGMSEETKQKVFNPFFTTKPVGKGTGLGMSITYKVIKNHNGNIEIESQEGIGTKFIITLPINIDRELMVKNNKEEEDIDG
ncbi:HAMP domain-containing histidine kinase [bacterium]|nr:HAMP domain-containing histidine kinase [bacterium]